MSDFDSMISTSALPCIMSMSGKSATYTPSGGSPISVTIRVDPASEIDRDGDGDGRVLRAERTIVVKCSEVSAPARGDKVTIDAVDWNVEEIEEKTGSWASLRIVRFERIERSADGYRRDRR